MSTENRYAWLFRRLPVIATLLDAEGRLTDVSDEWVNRLGYTRDEILGRSPQDIATPESAKQIREEHLPLIRRTGPAPGPPSSASFSLHVPGDVSRPHTGGLNRRIGIGAAKLHTKPRCSN